MKIEIEIKFKGFKGSSGYYYCYMLQMKIAIYLLIQKYERK